MLTGPETETAGQSLDTHVFTSTRLVNRPLAERDLPLYCSLYTDARIMRHIAAPLSQARAERAFWTSLKLMAAPAPTLLSWVITDKLTGEPLGIQGFSWAKASAHEATAHNKATADKKATAHKADARTNVRQDAARAEIGIMLLRSANGKLIPEEAMGALMQHGFDRLGLKRIDAQFAKRNLATERFVKKLGFCFDDASEFKADADTSDSRHCHMLAEHWFKREKVT
ncbi:GNAT family N-acetyltransferase [Shewanella salipaludis]|uniref:GNAT family N-acetyltransferase n=1 Tax=Shewanella salipaludis TaxID=2723052 RepID=A0A972G5Q0_9GAMM|nr:GNAT family N-acetyltransferase [Shewanella salipaludis]NMH64950.1 GNAT family N-acetyltransferase [Shewanella salipaludis]